ncbi:MAG: DUF4114 domain-containing protein [Rhodanobacter sp.]
MNRYKSLGLVGLAAASLFATQAFAAVPTPGPSGCAAAPTPGAVMGGTITCVASYGSDGVGTGLANYLNEYDPVNNPNGLVASGPGINPYTQQSGPNASWSLGAGGNTSTILLEIAGNAGANTFGIYDLTNINNTFQLFSGTDSAGNLVTLTFDGSGVYSTGGVPSATFGSGSLFGYYLGTPGNGIFYSDPSKNSIGVQQFVEFAGDGSTLFQTGAGTTLFDSSKYLLAWEDMLATSSDQDYNDFVVIVTANPGVQVPEPAVLGMFGIGALMIGLFGGLRRRREEV